MSRFLLLKHLSFENKLIGGVAISLIKIPVQIYKIEWVVSVTFACRLVIVESEPDKTEVYRHWGFEPIEDFEEKRFTMFLEIPPR